MVAQLLRITLCLGLTLQSAVASFLDGSEQPVVVWPNIPALSAADVEEYKQDRKIFRDLHSGEANVAMVKTNLKQVDKLYQHHKERSTDQIWRSYSADLVGHYDQLLQQYQITSPRLRFSFDNVSPAELTNELNLSAEPIVALRERTDVVGVVGFLTYTKMSGSQIRATLTLVRLRDGASIAMSVTDQLHKVATRHAQLLFDALYGTQYPGYSNPLSGMAWLLPAPADKGKQVSHRQATLACGSQQGRLPTVDELILGEQAGPYHNGIILSTGAFYHTAGSRRYLAGKTLDPRGKVRQLYSEQQLAHYYCIKAVELPAPIAPEVKATEVKAQAAPEPTRQSRK